MSKHFKLKIFQSCRSKDPSTLPENPVRSFKRHVSTALSCGGGGGGGDYTGLERFQWEKEDEWHVIEKVFDDEEENSHRRKVYNSAVSGDEVLTFPALTKKKRQSRKKKYSSDSGEETETLFSSSRSLSTESSRRRKKKKTKKVKNCKKLLLAELETPARLSVLKRVISCEIEGKVKESFAVVKKSEDPFTDFKKSMMEMIVEKRMFEESDLEQLLQCFLSLNSTHHHRVIVRAFSEIWNALFGATY